MPDGTPDDAGTPAPIAPGGGAPPVGAGPPPGAGPSTGNLPPSGGATNAPTPPSGAIGKAQGLLQAAGQLLSMVPAIAGLDSEEGQLAHKLMGMIQKHVRVSKAGSQDALMAMLKRQFAQGGPAGGGAGPLPPGAGGMPPIGAGGMPPPSMPTGPIPQMAGAGGP